MYSCISDTVSGTIGESLNSIRENLQSVSTTVDSFFAQIGEYEKVKILQKRKTGEIFILYLQLIIYVVIMLFNIFD